MNLPVRFVRSKAGRALLVYLAFVAAISAAVAHYFYDNSLQSLLAQKADEKITALKLVDSFVTTYSRTRSQFGQDAPVPATFRAHSIEAFNKQPGTASTFILRWVGREGRQITTPPADAEMAKTIEEFVTSADRNPKSALKTIDGRQILRTIYPSLANEQSCVSCHNQIQAGKQQWQLNDVMGAFAIDVPVGPFLQNVNAQSNTVALCLFAALAAIGLAISILHFRQWSEREAVASHMQTQNIRFTAALNNMSHGLCIFDGDRRLVVSNEAYARIYSLPPELVQPGTTHEAIIKHRVAHGILAGESTQAAAEQKLAALNKHSSDEKSTRVDKLSNGRQIEVTRQPMLGGGWLATHEDVTARAQIASERSRRDTIDSAISSFRSRVESVLKSVSESTKAMKSTAAELFASSEQTTRRAEGMVQASQGASTSVGRAAVAASQMSGSSSEIGQQVNQASKIVQNAESKVKATNNEFAGLSNAAQKIGDVIKLIQKISGQTNLLALNATIEAVRAGEAGRGFTVVASEVKALALQTSNAAQEVSSLISAVQASTKAAIQAVGSIEACIGEISSYTSAVSYSIQQQGAATTDITSNVVNASQETSKIVAVLGAVADAATSTRSSAQVVLSASESVEGAVDNLRREVEGFLGNVAA
jgi:methyl-accepting chemotaxis protein